ncbi:MAG: hypothetical protein HYV36_08165 [Lentisphaerae bacterium]|nr:hypothetical protein [Lentisphaerota bacterium]
MKNATNDLNRPVHLARRDAFLEKAFEVVRAGLAEAPHKQRAQHIDLTLYCLQGAIEHGSLAANEAPTSGQEAPFLLFIRLVLSNLHSVRVIMESEHALKDRTSPLGQFLHRNVKADDVAGFVRETEQLLQGVVKLAGLAEAPFRAIQKTLTEGMNASDRKRYQRAYDGLKHHLETRTHQRGFTPGRIFSPVLEMKYE